MYRLTTLLLLALCCTTHATPSRHRKPDTRWFNYDLIRDISGNGNTATNYGAVLSETADGWVGSFDDVTNGVFVSPTNVLSQASGALVISYETSTNAGFLYTVTSDGASYYWQYIALEGDTLAIRSRNGDSATKNYMEFSGLESGKHTVALHSDGSTLSAYMDGTNKPLSVTLGSNEGRWFDFLTNGYFNIGSREAPVENYVGKLFRFTVYGSLSEQALSNVTAGISITNTAMLDYTFKPEYK